MNELIEAIKELNYTMQDIQHELKKMRDEIYMGTLPEEVREKVRKQRIKNLIDSIDAGK